MTETLKSMEITHFDHKNAINTNSLHLLVFKYTTLIYTFFLDHFIPFKEKGAGANELHMGAGIYSTPLNVQVPM